ncbi:hypothetical protein G6F61_014834 [Rhizopus arrhizus]|nr:hypothetical protein G6F61_014834 [Rhizopus arrhizus]
MRCPGAAGCRRSARARRQSALPDRCTVGYRHFPPPGARRRSGPVPTAAVLARRAAPHAACWTAPVRCHRGGRTRH